MRAAAGNDPPLFWDAHRGGIQRSIQILILTFDLDVGLVDPIALIDRLQITVEDILYADFRAGNGHGSGHDFRARAAVVLQSCQHGLGRRPDILQECENHGHLCSNGDTSNLR